MMKTRSLPYIALLSILAIPAPVVGQSIGDVAAWAALSSTPTGGLPSAPFLPAALRSSRSLTVRYGRLNGEEGLSLSNIGVSFSTATKRGGQISASVGTGFCEGCSGSFGLGFTFAVGKKA
jgi:hypothetical protein